MKRLGACLLLLAVSCAGRDYTSLNKSSWEFTKFFFRESNEMRRDNLKRIDLKAIHAENKHLRKTSRSFTRDAFLGDERYNAKDGWNTLKWMLEWDAAEARKSIRFGHLDTLDE